MKVIFGNSHRRTLGAKIPSMQVVISGLSLPVKVRGEIPGTENVRLVFSTVRTSR
jgi:hypothetical protein